MTDSIRYDTVQTTGEYWDCECEHNYIHKKTDRTICARCGTEEEDQPDSRVGEVIAAILESRRHHVGT